MRGGGGCSRLMAGRESKWRIETDERLIASFRPTKLQNTTVKPIVQQEARRGKERNTSPGMLPGTVLQLVTVELVLTVNKSEKECSRGGSHRLHLLHLELRACRHLFLFVGI